MPSRNSITRTSIELEGMDVYFELRNFDWVPDVHILAVKEVDIHVPYQTDVTKRF